MTDFTQSLAISASGMRAQGDRLRLSAENMANIDTPGYLFATSDADVRKAVEMLRFPLIVKHPSSYASTGLTPASRVQTATDLAARVREMADAYGGRGMVRKETGNIPGALSDFDAAIRLDPAMPTGWYFRALIRKESGDLRGAKADLEQVLKVLPPADGRVRSVKGLLVQIQSELEG